MSQAGEVNALGPSVAVAIPAHDEAEAIGEFIAEIDAALGV